MKIQTIDALTLWQPWAQLMAWNWKTIESRSWSTKYPKRIAIHSAKTWNNIQKEFLAEIWTSIPTHPHGILNLENMVFGNILAIVELVNVAPTYKGFEKNLAPLEAKLGDYRPGRYAWYTNLIYELPLPILAAGKQGLWKWEIPDELSQDPNYIKALKDNRR